MLELTVKTLDSTNTSFTLCDEATVYQLKESIVDKMEVPIEMQRLIYHGKVLQDEKKLTDYGDINGKVIHLVERAPPSASRGNDGSSRRTDSTSGADPERPSRRRGGRPPNPTFIGSMAISDFPGFSPEDIQGMGGLEMPTRPTQYMARNRLESANRMLTYARQSINNMVNPPAPAAAAESNERSAGSADNDNMSATLLSATPQQAPAVQSPPSTGPALRMEASDYVLDENDVAVEVIVETESQPGAPPVEDPPITGPPSNDNQQEIVTRTDAMVPLLSQLEAISTDLQPMLARCREILHADTSFDDNTSAAYEEAQRVFNGVTETLHSVAHACHALSDLMVDFEEDAPRSLRCRPVVLHRSPIGIEHGVMHRVVTGGAPPHPPPAPSSTTGSATATATGTTTASNTNPAPPEREGAPRMPRMGGMMRSGGLEIFMDFSNMEVTGTHNADMSFTIMNPNTDPAGPAPAPAATAATSSARMTPHPRGHAHPECPLGPPAPPPTQAGEENFTNLRSFMNAIRNTWTPPADMANARRTPPDSDDNPFRVQPNSSSDLPVASGQAQFVVVVDAISDPAGSAAPTGTSSGTGSGSSGGGRPSEGIARPEPPPTPAPHGGRYYRAVPDPPRPFVAARRTGANIVPPVNEIIQTLFGSVNAFDPALPCNSHHIRRTRQRLGTNSQMQRLRVAVPDMPPPPPLVPLDRVRTGWMAPATLVAVTVPGAPSGLPTGPPVGQAAASATAPPGLAAAAATAAAAAAAPNADRSLVLDFPVIIDMLTNSSHPSVIGSATAAEVLNTFLEGNHVEGQSLICDLLMTLARNMTWVDVIELIGARSTSNFETQLGRLRPVLAGFITQRLLDGAAPSNEILMRTAQRLNTEMAPYITAMESATTVREAVDMRATISNYNMVELPELLKLIMDTNNSAGFGPDMRRSLTQYVERLVALLKYCCYDPVNGFSTAVRDCIRLMTRGVPEELRTWTELQSVNNLICYTSGLTVPDEDILGYIKYRQQAYRNSFQQEEMETEPYEGVSRVLAEGQPEVEEPLLAINTENLPEVLIGSEPWHNSLHTDWVPVIARDASRQRRQSSQLPFSDAYLTGMPPKRRKLIQQNKPTHHPTLAATISDGVRQAIDAAGVPTAVAEAAAAVAGADPAVQLAYREQMRAAVRSYPSFPQAPPQPLPKK